MKKRTIIAIIAAAAMMLAACSSSSSGGFPDDYNYDDLSRYIKLGEYKGIEYTKADTSVSDAEVKAKVDKALEQNVETKEIKEGTVAEDSVVNIDYVGSIDGVEFEGGTAQGQELDIANSTYIKGFAEGIVGHKVGETFDLNVTFPDDYGKEELAGKPAVFKTTINFIVGKKTPEYTDEWVKANTSYKTKAQYEQSIKDELTAEKEKSASSSEMDQVYQKIDETSEVIEYPEKELQDRHDRIVKTYEEAARSAGMELDDYVSQSMGIDTDTFNEQIDEACKTSVKTELILHAIADAEGVELSDEGYSAYLDELLKDAGYTRDSFKEEKGVSIDEYADQNNLFMPYLYKTVMTRVMEFSKAK